MTQEERIQNRNRVFQKLEASKAERRALERQAEIDRQMKLDYLFRRLEESGCTRLSF